MSNYLRVVQSFPEALIDINLLNEDTEAKALQEYSLRFYGIAYTVLYLQ
jgi:hypothetical protein